MTYVTKLLELDRRLRMKLPMAPIQTRPPTPAEIQAKIALRASLQGHAGTVAHAVGISRA